MHYYTKQQLQGAGKYSPGCLIGNWNEDLSEKEAQLREFLKNKENGHLKIFKIEKEIKNATKVLQLNKGLNYISLKTNIQIKHTLTNQNLSHYQKINDNTKSCNFEYFTTLTKNNIPMIRSTFTLHKCNLILLTEQDIIHNDDILHYGQKIIIKGYSPETDEDELILSSLPSTRLYSNVPEPFTEQLVGLSNIIDENAIWIIKHPIPELNILKLGLKIEPNDDVCIFHFCTGQALCANESIWSFNDFGKELMVFAKSIKSRNKQNFLEHMNKGEVFGSVEKPLAPENHWKIITE